MRAKARSTQRDARREETRLPPYRVCRYGSVGGLNIHTYKKKVLANNLYNRLKVIYPQYTNLPADRMLSPMYVYEITDSLRSASQISSWRLTGKYAMQTMVELETLLAAV